MLSALHSSARPSLKEKSAWPGFQVPRPLDTWLVLAILPPQRMPTVVSVVPVSGASLLLLLLLLL